MIDQKSRKKVAEQLLEIFGGNNYHAVGKTRRQEGGVWYEYIKDSPLTKELIEAHLKGSIVLGSYPINKDNKVRWIAWDIDAKDDMKTAREYAEKIISNIDHLPYIVEFSGGKGYHIFLLLNEAIPAKRAKVVAEYIRDKEGLPKTGIAHVECFPKQEYISVNSADEVEKPGNLIKIPLGQHVATHEWSKLIDPLNGWEEAPPLEPTEVLLYRVSPKQVLALADEEVDPFEEMVKILVHEWHSGVRHDLALAVNGYIASIGWNKNDAMRLMKRVCEETGDEDIENRLQTVKTTFKRHAEDKPVAGFSKLSEIIHPNSQRIFIEQAFRLVLPPTAQKIQQIRLAKGPIFIKRDKVVNIIMSELTDPDRGKLLVTESSSSGLIGDRGKLFWFSSEEKLVIPLDSMDWKILMAEKYRIIRTEAFSRTVNDQLELECYNKAQKMTVYRKSAFINGRLYVNLGSSKTFVLDGKEIEIQFNGDNSIFFQSKRGVNLVEPDFSNPKDIWEFLVDDINFSVGMEATIPPKSQKELMKVWILSTFFGTTIPVRPILTMLGERGSGKTTAMQRMLKIIEGSDANVTSIANEKPDSWRAVVQESQVVILDNLEKIQSANWLIKELNIASTGGSITLRRLFTNNSSYTIDLDVFVGITAINMPFKEEALNDRLLPLSLDRLDSFVPVQKFNRSFSENEKYFWADLLNKLNQVVYKIKMSDLTFEDFRNTLRFSDFVMFCRQISDCDFIEQEALLAGIDLIQASQSEVMVESDQGGDLISLIDQWIKERPSEVLGEKSASQFFELWRDFAKHKRINFPWKNLRALLRHIRAIEITLIRLYGFASEKRYSEEIQRKYLVFQFTSVDNKVKTSVDKITKFVTKDQGKTLIYTDRVVQNP